MKRLLPLLMCVQFAEAATLNWPGSGGCAGTLQACIDAAASGDTVQIVTEGVINESLSLSNKSLTLTSRGPAARFGDDRSIQITAAADNVNITLSNLHLRGAVRALIGSGSASDTQTLNLDNLQLNPSGPGLGAVDIAQASGANSSYTVTVQRSQLSQASAAGSAVFLSRSTTGSARATLNVFNNFMQVRGSGVAAFISSTDSAVNVNGNRIGRIRQFSVGSTLAAGVFVSAEGGGPAPASVRVTRNVLYNLDSAVVLRAQSASLSTSVLNNTISSTNLAAISLAREAAFTISGRIANTIVHRSSGCGLDFASTEGLTVTHNFNLYSQSATPYCGTTAGANDLNNTARFRSQYDFRALGGDAPQVNRGSNSDQPQVTIIVPVPLPDIDGRSGRVSTVDIGAHERSFDQSFEHQSRAGNVAFNITRVDAPPVGLLPDDHLTLSHYGRPIDGVTPLPIGAANHTGVWYSGSLALWTVFNQNTSETMQTNRRFFMLLNIDTQQSIVHTATAGNTSLNVTTLDHPQLNSQPDALPIVTQRWDPAQTGSGVYNNSSIGVWYDSSINRWRVFNQSPGGLAPNVPTGAAFNVLIPNPLFAPGAHAYRTTPLAVPAQVLNLDHPLLNNVECAHPFVTSVFNPNSVYVPSNLVLSYNPASDGRGNWAIERGDGAQIPAGAAFHVYIDPQRSRICRIDPLMIDGFE